MGCLQSSNRRSREFGDRPSDIPGDKRNPQDPVASKYIVAGDEFPPQREDSNNNSSGGGGGGDSNGRVNSAGAGHSNGPSSTPLSPAGSVARDYTDNAAPAVTMATVSSATSNPGPPAVATAGSKLFQPRCRAPISLADLTAAATAEAEAEKRAEIHASSKGELEIPE